MRKKLEIKECICGNHNYHTRGCKGHNRHIYQLEYQKKIRHEKRKKHICIIPGCDTKVKPVLVYH
ncbi:MAG: hypothetical protein AABY22_02040, partial [Nanoarchaeota archaeon]